MNIPRSVLSACPPIRSCESGARFWSGLVSGGDLLRQGDVAREGSGDVHSGAPVVAEASRHPSVRERVVDVDVPGEEVLCDVT